GHAPGRLSANPSSVSGGTVGLSIPAPAAQPALGIAPGSQLHATGAFPPPAPSTWQMIRRGAIILCMLCIFLLTAFMHLMHDSFHQHGTKTAPARSAEWEKQDDYSCLPRLHLRRWHGRRSQASPHPRGRVRH